MAPPDRSPGRSSPELVIIAAVADGDRVIGRDRDLPWHIPADLKRFKRLTSGRSLIMGRRTFESIIHQFGSTLPGRHHVVVSGSGRVQAQPDVTVVSSLDEAMDAVSGEDVVFIGGGATIYEQMLDRVDRLELTHVEGHHEGDTFFPPYEHLIGSAYTCTAEERHDGFRFATYERISAATDGPIDQP